MPPPVRSIMEAVAAYVPEPLVPASTRAAVARLAPRLPPAFNWLGFECRLRAGDDRVDFAGCCEAHDGGRARLAAAVCDDPGLVGAGPAALVRAWNDAADPLHRQAPAIWLEFDLSAGVTLPFAFLCLDPACAGCFRDPRRLAPPAPPAPRVLELIERGATHLLGHPPDRAAFAAASRLIAALPPAGRALHVAATPHRGHEDLRLHFALFARDLPAWLDRVAWPGDRGLAAEALEILGGGFRQVGVQVSVGHALRPTLGIEAYVARGPADFPAWARTFAALASRGASEPAKAQAALDWWGQETRVLPGEPWFVDLQRQFYLKLSLGPEGLEAKVYLAIFACYTL